MQFQMDIVTEEDDCCQVSAYDIVFVLGVELGHI